MFDLVTRLALCAGKLRRTSDRVTRQEATASPGVTAKLAT
jgi:hypothetical protein